jgi:hypothetical protein
MRRVKTITVADREVAVREMTVREIRDWLKDMEADAGDADYLGMSLLEGVTLADVARMTDLSVADMDGFLPSEIDTIVAACQEVNPGFFRVAAPMLGIVRRALDSYARSGLSGQSADLYEQATQARGSTAGRFISRLFRK